MDWLISCTRSIKYASRVLRWNHLLSDTRTKTNDLNTYNPHPALGSGKHCPTTYLASNALFTFSPRKYIYCQLCLFIALLRLLPLLFLLWVFDINGIINCVNDRHQFLSFAPAWDIFSSSSSVFTPGSDEPDKEDGLNQQPGTRQR